MKVHAVRVAVLLCIGAALMLVSACSVGSSSTTVTGGATTLVTPSSTGTSVAESTTEAGSTSTEAASTTTAPAESSTTESSTTTTAAPTTTTLPQIIPGVTTLKYVSSTYGFSIRRPKTASVVTSGFDGFLPLTKKAVVGIVLPKSLFHGTNLQEAAVYIGASKLPAVLAAWNMPVAAIGETGAGTTAINGVSFAIFTSSDAGAGNYYEQRTYRVVHKGTCFEITEFLHSNSIGNYTPGTVQEFDKVKFQGYLEAIVDTFRFTK